MLSSQIGFLMVFRLNLAAIRYLDSRERWMKIVETARVLMDTVAIQYTLSPSNGAALDATTAWTMAFAVATMAFLHGDMAIHPSELAGILGPADVHDLLNIEGHMPLFASSMIHSALVAIFGPGDASKPTGAAVYRASVLRSLEGHVDTLVGAMGVMERITGAPLHSSTTPTCAPLMMCLALMQVFFLWGLRVGTDGV